MSQSDSFTIEGMSQQFADILRDVDLHTRAYVRVSWTANGPRIENVTDKLHCPTCQCERAHSPKDWRKYTSNGPFSAGPGSRP